MNKSIISLVFCFVFMSGFSQEKEIVTNESRSNVPPHAVIDIQSYMEFYKGQEYTFSLAASTSYDVEITSTNLKVRLVEESKRSTGGLRYTITPVDTGECSLSVGLSINEKRYVSLISRNFRVINYPLPPIYIDDTRSGEIIESLDNSTLLNCKYPPGTGIFDSYDITSWSAKLGDKTFTGNGNSLTQDLIKEINNCNTEQILRITANLVENKTGYKKSEAVFIIY